MATNYVYSHSFTFKSDSNKSIEACLYFRFDDTLSDTQAVIHAVSAGLAFRKNSGDADQTFKLLTNSTATKNVRFNNTDHKSTVTRTSDRNCTATAVSPNWNYQSFGTWDYTYTIARQAGVVQIVPISIEGTAKVSSSHDSASVITNGNINYAVPDLPHWTVKLNANGGTNGSKTSFVKYYNATAYFPAGSESPTRSGWTWLGWGTSPSSTSPSYVSYSAYTANAGATFYAIWRKTLYLSYNANGGSGAPGRQSGNIYNSTTGMTFKISSAKPTRAGYIFNGWSTSPSAASASYQPGGLIHITESSTLYAVWSPDPTLGVSGASTENTYTVYTSVNSEVIRSVNIYENGTLIKTADVKGNNSFTFTGKRPETSFTVRVDLLDGSTVIATKTITVATVNSDIVLTGSNSDSTYTSVKATASGMKASTSFVKTIEWQYALASSPNAKTTFYSETLGVNATSNTATITGLIPGRMYNITAIYYVDGYQTDIKTIALTTKAMEGSLDITGRGISTVIATLKDLTAIPYDIKAKVSYKEASSSEWILKQTHDIYANAQADILTTISALRASTTYDIKAEILRASDSALITTFTTQVTTKAYVPGVAPAPFIDDYIVVPYANVAYIRWHVEGDMDGFTLKLKEMMSDETVETSYDVTDLGGIKTFKKNMGVWLTRKYQLVVVDGNDEEHNPTEIIKLNYRNVEFTTDAAGDVLAIKATRVHGLADAVLKAYTFIRATRETDPDVQEEQDILRTRLVEAVSHAAKGEPIKGTTGTSYDHELPLLHIIPRFASALKTNPGTIYSETKKNYIIRAAITNKNLNTVPKELFTDLRNEVN